MGKGGNPYIGREGGGSAVTVDEVQRERQGSGQWSGGSAASQVHEGGMEGRFHRIDRFWLPHSVNRSRRGVQILCCRILEFPAMVFDIMHESKQDTVGRGPGHILVPFRHPR